MSAHEVLIYIMAGFAVLGGMLTANSFILSYFLPGQKFAATFSALFGAFVLAMPIIYTAVKDLLSGKFTLDEISRKWNFFDTAHFCHAFKKFYRVSPGQFGIGKPGIKSEK